MDKESLFRQIIANYGPLKYALLDAQTFDESHYGFPEVYYEVMQSDLRRIDAFRRSFAQYDMLRDKVVCEAGVGTLALSRYYLPFVKKAYLIESNPALSDQIHRELKEKGWDHKVVFIEGDAMQTILPEPVDFIIGELMSIFCANEYQVQIFQHLRQFLKPDGKLIPEKILNWAQLSRASFENEHLHYPIFFSRHLPEFLSPPALINTIDLYKTDSTKVDIQTRFSPALSGQANSVFLTSWISLCAGINFTGTDSLMPPTVRKLESEQPVIAGEILSLQSTFTYGTSLNQARFRIK
ncbi:MAG: hypothetical protein GYB31_10505 [Bacteroidetes bacterium]|nr:hypothetical protein [Bacteroidota bacterium]